MRIFGPPSGPSSVVVTFEPAGICRASLHTGQRYKSECSMALSRRLLKTCRKHARGGCVTIEESRRTFVGVGDDLMAPNCSFVALSALEQGGLPCFGGSSAVLVTE